MHFLVTGSLKLPAGSVVSLSAAQLATRRHAVEPMPKRKGWYRATLELCFKAGEAIQYDGELPKSLADQVEAPKRTARASGQDTAPGGGSEGDDTAPGGDDTSAGGDA